MSLIERRWIRDQAINNSKVDPSDTYTITGLRVDETNAVGRISVGTNNPLDALHMRRTDTSVGIILDLDGYSGKSYQLYSDQSGDFHIRDIDNSVDRLTLNSTPSVHRMGIDQTNPQDTLDVRSTLAPAALRLDTDDGFSGRTYRLVSDTDGAFKIIDVDAGDVNRLQIADNGTLTVSGDATFDSNFQINGTVTVINTEIVIADQLEINQTDNQAALIVSQDTPSATATVMRVENAGTGHALTIDSGNVGIGTTDPLKALQVVGEVITSSNVGIGTTNPLKPLQVVGDIITDSNVGIGTTNPNARCYILNSVDAPTTILRITNEHGGTSAATMLSFGHSTHINAGSIVYYNSTHATKPNHFDIINQYAAPINLYAGTANLTLLSNNNVGIGSTVPTSALDVVGNIISSGSMTAGTGVSATTGNISAVAGAVSANTTVTAGTGVTATTGNITASAGNVIASATVQGANLNITTGPNTIVGTTTNTGTFNIQNTTEAVCNLIRTASGSNVAFGVSNGSPSTWATGINTGDSYIKSSASNYFHIGSANLTVPTVTFSLAGNVGIGTYIPTYPLHMGGNDVGTGTVVDKIAIGNAATNTGALNDSWRILFRHRTTSGNTPTSGILSVIGSGLNKSDIVLSPSGPGTAATETIRVYRTAADSYMDLKTSSGGNTYFTTYQGAFADYRVRTIYNGSNPDKIVEMGAINGGQTHITYGAGSRGISMLSAGATPGYVGIGTQTPSAKLHVIGNAIVSGVLTVGSLTLPLLNITGPTNVHMQITRTGTGNGSVIYAVTDGPGNYGWATPAAGSSLIQYSSGKSLYIGSSGAGDPYAVFTSTGNVGIGTQNPSSLLHVYGTSVPYFLVSNASVSAIVQAYTSDVRIGALSAHNLGLYSSGLERMVINTSGNVGIGTTNPGFRLEVNADIVAKGGTVGGGAGNYLGLFKSNGSLPGYPTHSYPVLKTDDSNIYFSTGGRFDADLGGADTALNMYDSAIGNKVSIRTNGSTFFNGGNVGIGTTNPSARCHIFDSVNATTGVLGINNEHGGTSAATMFSFGHSAHGNAGSIIYYNIAHATKPNHFDIVNQYAAPINLYAGTANLTLLPSNNVGIGTTNPGAKLHVDGGIFTANGANIGDNTHRVDTIYMSSTINHLSNLYFNSNGPTQITFDTNGYIGINTSPSYHMHVAGRGYFEGTVQPLTAVNSSTAMFATALSASISSVSSHAQSYAVYAYNAGAGRAVYALANTGYAGYFSASSGYAGYFTTTSGVTVRMDSNSAAGGNYVLQSVCSNASASTDSIAIMAQNYGNGRAIYATSGSGDTIYADSDSGRALDATAGTGYAGYFQSGSGGTVHMQCDSAAAGNYVLRSIAGAASHSDSIAVYASNWGAGMAISATSGANTAIYGSSSSSNGVRGYSGGGTGTGIYGDSNGTSNYSGYFTKQSSGTTLYAESNYTSSNTLDIRSFSTSSNTIRVTTNGADSDSLYVTTSGARGIGLYSIASATDATAVYGVTSSSGGVAISGYSSGSSSYAGHFITDSGTCVYSEVINSSTWCNGIYVTTNPSTGSSSAAYAIYAIGGRQNSGTYPGYAGYFVGDVHVTGWITAASKPFRIDHPLDPENKYLFHNAVECPEMRTVYYGQTSTKDGTALINLPDWWIALNGTDKSEYTYSLTPIGKWCQLYVSKEIEDNQFEVSSTDEDCKFSWTVTAIRHDVVAEENRVRVEMEKSEEDKKRDREEKRKFTVSY